MAKEGGAIPSRQMGKEMNEIMERRVFLKNVAAGAVLLAAPGVEAAAESERRPNIVYVFADQLRASALGYAGDPNINAPHIDRLAEESVNFRNTVSVCPVCTPYRAALMTGRFPTTTGMFLNDLHLPSKELCLPEIFADAGYDTGYIGKWHLDGHGRDSFVPPARRQGWEYWKAAECDHNNYDSHYYTGDLDEKRIWDGYDVFAQTGAARRYIREHAGGDRPFILMVSYGPPHPASREAPDDYIAQYAEEDIELPPNVPPEEEEAARGYLREYYAHTTAIDHSVGELLETLEETGAAEDTIFVFTSDHGGMLLSHGLPQHWKQVAYGESAHVPFLLRYPAAHGSQRRTVRTPLNTPDILPTLLGLAGIEVPGPVEGEDLSALVTEGGEIPGRAALYMSVAPFNYGLGAYRAVRTDRYTYVRNREGPWLLFDDREDPHQIDNLVDKEEHQSTRRELDEKLQAELDKIGDDFRAPDSYLEEWGYEVNDHGAIPYHGDPDPQTPRGEVDYS